MHRTPPAQSPLPADRSWVAFSGVTRRSAIAATAFAAGFAAACQPVAATTIKTDGAGLDESMASAKGADGFAIPLFVARPKGGKAAPVVLVVHEIFGLHEWVKDICRRFAEAGYIAVAPDLFARVGDATKLTDYKEIYDKIVNRTSDAQVLSDLDQTAAWAAANGGKGKPAITGFCWGGRIVWLYAAHSDNLSSGVAFYGRLRGDLPTKAIDQAARLRAPVLGQYGGKDQGIPLTDVEAMNAALKATGSPSHITVYPQADHGFMADYRPSYDEASAKAAWAATLAWFERHRS